MVATQLLNPVADTEVQHQTEDDGLLELRGREGNQFEAFSQLIGDIESDHSRHEEHKDQHPFELDIFWNRLHKGPTAVVNENNRGL